MNMTRKFITVIEVNATRPEDASNYLQTLFITNIFSRAKRVYFILSWFHFCLSKLLIHNKILKMKFKWFYNVFGGFTTNFTLKWFYSFGTFLLPVLATLMYKARLVKYEKVIVTFCFFTEKYEKKKQKRTCNCSKTK